jgi:Na+/H+-dicarboxylate symporter
VIKIEFAESITIDNCCRIYPEAGSGLDLPNPDDMRTEDQNIVSVSRAGIEYGYVISNMMKDNDLNAILSILRTIFVSILLGGASMLFSKDVEDIVLSPIENMLNKVKRISENPLEAAQIEERETFVYDDMMKEGNQKLIK